MYLKEEVARYLNQFEWKRDHLLLRLEKEAKEEEIPIIHLESIQLISQLVRMKQAESILEIGTAIGYSTIWLAWSHEKARVISMEIDEEKVVRARENIAAAGIADRVTILHRNAELGLPEELNDAKFDFIFIDAAKAQYGKYLDLYLPKLKEGGVVVTDNILFHGTVYQTSSEPRKARLGEKVHQFNLELFSHPQLLSTLLPIGDGIAISIKGQNNHFKL
jgi:predicted O-methyltransferase YrrM